MKTETFAVKTQVIEKGDEELPRLVLVSLGENLSWQDAVELRKQNKGSWTHPMNRDYGNADLAVRTKSKVKPVKPASKRKRS